MELEIITIRELFDKKFLIPAYQRGYRWESKQVEELLNDLNDFFNNFQNDGYPYFLQPLVIKKENNKYRVIDGQQRLTTIYLILKYFERYIRDEDEFGLQEPFYKIEYETRKNSEKFLANIGEKTTKKYAQENIDFYYMYEAFSTIQKWYKKKREENKIKRSKFIESLLFDKIKVNNKEKIGRVTFIWYEIKYENENKVFKRLNIGKIPLTDSELIKTLFLKPLDKKDRLKLISEWDYILYTLNNDTFFSFVTNKEYKDRMEFIFELPINKKRDKKQDRYLFNYYEKILNSKKDVEVQWMQIKRYFRALNEFFENNEYYHFIGFIINAKKGNIKDILKEYFKKSKNEFLQYLKNKSSIKINKDFDMLNYHQDKKQIEDILFLFNVLIALKEKGFRYPFDLHNKEKWSLEHIHAIKSEDINIKDETKMRELLESQKKYVNDKEIKKKIKELLQQETIENEEFIKIQEEILNIENNTKNQISNIKNQEKIFDIDSIYNLALLGLKNNIILSNSIFPAKREKLIELEKKEDRFIPIATKYIFLKYFSNNENLYKWDIKDMKDYRKILKKNICQFIKKDAK